MTSSQNPKGLENKKLRAAWSPELAKDIEGFHSINAEEELVKMLSDEIDRQIMRELIINALDSGNIEINEGMKLRIETDPEYMGAYAKGVIKDDYFRKPTRGKRR